MALDTTADMTAIALTIAGVTVVVADPRGEPTWRGPVAGASRSWAIVAGLLGGLGQGSGLVLAKLGMLDVEGEVEVAPFPATVVRMIANRLAFSLRLLQAMRSHSPTR